MASYDRDPIYIHPIVRSNLKPILVAIEAKLPAGHRAKLVSGHRSPQDQFEIFRKGREFRNGSWVKVGTTYTNIDGFTRLSMHNYLPCLAIDIGLFDQTGKYLTDSPLYRYVRVGATLIGLNWGGDWTSFVDRPHLELPKSMALKSSFVKEAALVWQRYLQSDGTYPGELDGLFGKVSTKALFGSVGSSVRDLATWKKLYAKLGPLI